MKKEYNKYIMLTIFILGLILLGMKPFCLFGSNTDWLNQHTVFPEYFRNLFYTTKQLIPNFALSLGAGQNIFHFSYYGLLNPIVLLSYLFPFVSMATYLQIANIILLIISVFLFYYFLKQKQLSCFSTWITTLLFISATPLIYQAHRHFMFVDYMPFLLLGLIAVDRYFKTGEKSLIALSIFLMIMTSYYYSIGGLFVIAIYYLYEYFQHNRFSLKELFLDGLRFLAPYLTGVLMACVLLLPTAFVVLHGRGDSHTAISLLDILLPKLDYHTFLYDGYGLGLTFISLLGMFFSVLSSKKERKFLGIACLLVGILPIFMFLLNGGLYIRSKVLIPFLPLYLLLTGFLLDDVLEAKKKVVFQKWLLIALFIGMISILLYRHEWYYGLFFLIDILVTILLLNRYQKTKKQYLLYGFVLLSCIVSVFTNQTETYVPIEKYQDINKEAKRDEIKRVNEQDQTLYRMKQTDYNLPILNKVYQSHVNLTTLYSSTQNMNYYQFYRTYFGNSISNRNNLMISSTPSFFFDSFMGVKYLVGSDGASQLGFEKVQWTKEIYQNKNAFPLMYATSHLVSKTEFEMLQYPYQSDVLLKNAIVEKGNQSAISNIQKVNLDYIIQDRKTGRIVPKKENYRFSLNDKKEYQITLPHQDLTNKIIFLQFDIKNKTGCEMKDRFITINGKTNKVTCDDWLYANDNYQFRYVFAEKGMNQNFLMTIEKGDYEIENIQIFLLDYKDVEALNRDVDSIVIDYDKTMGDHIEGEITVTNDGYFVTSIPYDDGFEILVDGKKVSYENVNQCFVGFPITKGHHLITFTYHSPWLKEGKLVSAIGFAIFGIFVIDDIFVIKKKKRLKHF